MATKTLDVDTAGAEEAQPDEELVRARAYELSLTEEGGTPEDNWLRAEQELHAAPDEASD